MARGEPCGRILVVDDERVSADAFREILSDQGFSVDCEYSAELALERLTADNSYFLLVSDIRLGGMTGMDLVARAKRLRPELGVILITAYGSISSAVEAMKLGIDDYLAKPVDFEKLRFAVARLAEKADLLRENRDLKAQIETRYSFSNIVGRSPAIHELFAVITKVAPSSATVLLRGESGTGKGLVARALHFNSPRHEEPLVEINCAALPDTLLESELFGHRKGAFTGAISDRIGRFGEAAGGTVFLDEIGEIGMNLQSKLLRILQEKVFEPVGSNTAHKLKARVIASTNRDLEKAVAARAFREDLYYRLNVVPIYLPPLRERGEDTPLLAEHFLNKYCTENNLPRKRLEPAAVDVLTAYAWPGNVRELENLIERLVIMIEREMITAHDLFALKRSLSPEMQPIKVGKLDDSIADYEKKIVEKALAVTEGNRTKAARILAISLRQLHYKIKKYGVR